MARKQGNQDRAWEFGEYGVEQVTATNSSTAGNTFTALLAIGGDAQVDITASRGGTTTLSNIALKEGIPLVLPVSSFSVDSGTVWGYLADTWVPAA